MKGKTNKVTIGYWAIRGRGQIPRLLLAYTGAVWEDVKYTAPEQWFALDRTDLQLPFPNLPYLIEGNFKLTETDAICRYIVERSDRQELLGKSLEERALVNNLVGVIHDLTQLIFPLSCDK
jgi:glutathione S-transferase